MSISIEVLNNYGLIDKIHDLELYDVPEDNDAWLAMRRPFVGASDVGAILGINKYCSPLQIYREKLEPDSKEDISKKPSVRKGKELESFILEEKVIPYFTDYIITKPTHMFVNRRYPWLAGNLDGIGVLKPVGFDTGLVHHIEDTVGFEIKYVTEWGESLWNGSTCGGIPEYYYSQVQTYMGITGIRKFNVCAFFEASWELHVFPIEFDPEFFENVIVKKTHTFFYENLAMHIPPRPMPSLDKEDVSLALTGMSTVVPTETASMSSDIKELLLMKEDIKLRTKAAATKEDEIINAFLEGQRPLAADGLSVSASKSIRRSLDTEKVLTTYPEAKQFLTETESIRWNINKKK